jgi:hypothetical protein
MPAAQPSPQLEDLLNDLSYWEVSKRQFLRQPNNSVLRQNLSQRIYQNPGMFGPGVDPVTIHDQIINQDTQAKAYYINYALDNPNEIVSIFNEEQLFGYAVRLNPDFQNLVNASHDRNALMQILFQRYNGRITSFSALDNTFVQRLYEATVDIDMQVIRKNLSVKNNSTLGLERNKEIAYVTNQINHMNPDQKQDFYINLGYDYAGVPREQHNGN